MASSITHLVVLSLAYFFPAGFHVLPLLTGALIPEAEYLLIYAKNFLGKKNIFTAYLHTSPGIMHTLLGALFIDIPFAMLISYLVSGYFGMAPVPHIYLVSVSVAVLSHLLLDLPGHKQFILFYPLASRRNPFLFKMRLGILERLYPWGNKERFRGEFLPEYNWWVFSHLFLAAAAAAVILLG